MFALTAFSKIPKVSILPRIQWISSGQTLSAKDRGKGTSKDDQFFMQITEEIKALSKKKKGQLDKNRPKKFGLEKLSATDCERRVNFALNLLPLLEEDPTLIHSIVFSDEAFFWPYSETGIGKKRDKKHFNESEPVPTIVWCGMNTKEIIGPYFFNSFVTDESYLKMIQRYLIPQMKCLNYDLSTTWFQQDGAPPHRSGKVLEFLKSTFQERLVSYGCPMAWPPRSQDLTPLDYFFWDYLNSRIEPFHPKTVRDLRECIALEVKVVEPEILEQAVKEFKIRLHKCLEANGQRFIMDKSKPII